MIKCSKCKNTTKFKEVVLGAVIETTYLQKKNGNFVKKDSENTWNDAEVIFECGKCGNDITTQHNALIENEDGYIVFHPRKDWTIGYSAYQLELLARKMRRLER